ncbi:MAG: ubiquinone biosynthesis protein UbiH [Candidatus Aquirickettsiella gammari]|uniref:Ubiquinone biosynthesis protein UbiH n=1 Tax=Candidatus Aquirickettsiella gammari TaxID=2016198 RepID=A0A370CG52_9COXI|nr:MAG: ubiquinone biosynthesis protein UbiH [Candidatus Aquirickettsiella gammari]
MKRVADYEIVIVGAAIAGLTLACHLMGKGLRIAILNKDNNQASSAKSTSNLASQLRVIAITLGSQQLLEKLQVWQRLTAEQRAPFRSLQVWEPAKQANLFFDSAELGQATLGYIVKNQDLQDALFTQVKTDQKISWFSSDALIDMVHEPHQMRLTLASGVSITTSLVVGADGMHSSVRQLAGLQVNASDYDQAALIATVRTELAHEEMARQIFLPTGPLAFLPLADPYHCSIVWSTTPEEARRLKAMSDPLFCAELAQVFEQRLGAIESTSPRVSFPLKTQQAEHYIKSAMALIGDAAHVIHPLAGQGANLGIADADCLAKIILAAKLKQRSLGALHTLRAYERQRRFHNRLMNGSVDGIKYLFATKNPLLRKTRQFGFSVLNKIPALKNGIARYAMGNPKI